MRSRTSVDVAAEMGDVASRRSIGVHSAAWREGVKEIGHVSV